MSPIVVGGECWRKGSAVSSSWSDCCFPELLECVMLRVGLDVSELLFTDMIKRIEAKPMNWSDLFY